MNNTEDNITKAFMKIPPFTRYYLSLVTLTSFLITYQVLSIVPYMTFDYTDAIFKLQIWRLFTNFLIVGKFSFGFLFFMLLMYQQISIMEKRAIESKKYSEFIMLLFYLACILLLINLIYPNKVYLSNEFLFSLIYIDSKRDPDKTVSLWGFVMKSKYFIIY